MCEGPLQNQSTLSITMDIFILRRSKGRGRLQRCLVFKKNKTKVAGSVYLDKADLLTIFTQAKQAHIILKKLFEMNKKCLHTTFLGGLLFACSVEELSKNYQCATDRRDFWNTFKYLQYVSWILPAVMPQDEINVCICI